MFSAKVARNIQCADAVDVDDFDTRKIPKMPKF